MLESVNNSQDRPPSCLHCDIRIRKCVDTTRESYLQAMLWHTAPKAPKAHLRGPRSTRGLQKVKGGAQLSLSFFPCPAPSFALFTHGGLLVELCSGSRPWSTRIARFGFPEVRVLAEPKDEMSPRIPNPISKQCIGAHVLGIHRGVHLNPTAVTARSNVNSTTGPAVQQLALNFQRARFRCDC